MYGLLSTKEISTNPPMFSVCGGTCFLKHLHMHKLHSFLPAYEQG